MKEVPKWIFKLIDVEGLRCRGCDKVFISPDLMSISIQESSQPPHKDFLCIGLYCHDCEELMIFEIKEMSLVEFAFDIVDQGTSFKIKRKQGIESNEDIDAIFDSLNQKKRREKSKITLREINEIKKFLKPKNLKHVDLLIAMGMSPNEINKYNFKKENKKKKNGK